MAPNAIPWADVLSLSLVGRSFGDVERDVTNARRAAALNGQDLGHHLVDLIRTQQCLKQEQIEIAVRLVRNGLVRNGLVTQRKAHQLTGVARDTIRVRLKKS